MLFLFFFLNIRGRNVDEGTHGPNVALLMLRLRIAIELGSGRRWLGGSARGWLLQNWENPRESDVLAC